MFWGAAKFYKAEVERLRKENRELLILTVELCGRREAANMMRANTQPTPKDESTRPKPQLETAGIGWRGIQKMLMRKTRPDTTSKDSVEELENRVKEVTQ